MSFVNIHENQNKRIEKILPENGTSLKIVGPTPRKREPKPSCFIEVITIENSWLYFNPFLDCSLVRVNSIGETTIAANTKKNQN